MYHLLTWGFRAILGCYHTLMITNEIVEYIKAQRASGKDDSIIRQSLLSGGGWDHTDVDEALAIAGPNAFAMPRPPAPPQPPRPTTPAIQVMPSAPATQPAPQAPVTNVASNPTPQPMQTSAPRYAPAPPPVPAPAPVSMPTPTPVQAPSNQWSSMPGQFTPRASVMPTQASVQPNAFQSPSSQNSQQMTPPARSHAGALIVTVIVLLLLGAGGYAYYAGFFSVDVVADPLISDIPTIEQSEAAIFTTPTATTSEESAENIDVILQDIENIDVDDASLEGLN